MTNRIRNHDGRRHDRLRSLHGVDLNAVLTARGEDAKTPNLGALDLSALDGVEALASI